MGVISGIHHVSMKCKSGEEYDNVVSFYTEVLGLKVARTWAMGIMFDAGNALIEVFANAENKLGQGVIEHFAFATDNVDLCIDKVRAAGYEITVEPKDVIIPSDPAFPARVA
ncbi:MAG: VOC family protein, partial [Lachnospiraceae bacterium]|nr:VOC family protein [Lachnospiraceae bacterium]